eukprot:TRINITY_DN10577_c0_g1_i1.p1 TRINITY_DN10577_c0_g1~~TRINITY_DN10577_c0_g1_i1.p1  ORF type:complete len:256 (-),score=41.29 TRINITY_DN10577_c0_g1_i1:157-924(-)
MCIRDRMIGEDIPKTGYRRRHFVPGNEGLVNYEVYHQARSVRLYYHEIEHNGYFDVDNRWRPFESGDAQDLKNIKVKYSLLITKDMNLLNLISRCGNKFLNPAKPIPGMGSSVDRFARKRTSNCQGTGVCMEDIDFNELGGEGSTFFVTVQGEVLDSATGEVTLVNYGIAEFPVEPDNSDYRLYLMIISLAMVILCVLAALFFKKYKKVEKQLKIEMQDVRNVAGLGSEPKASPQAAILNTQNKSCCTTLINIIL